MQRNATWIQNPEINIDLDDLFNDIYYLDLPGAPADAQPEPVASLSSSKPVDDGDVGSTKKRSADDAGLGSKASVTSSAVPTGELTEQQKIERRERNREHAKRSRLRKKFLLESLQQQIHELEDQLERYKSVLKEQLPAAQAESIITQVAGDREKYTPLPMPSGFGPVKTLMEPDFRLSKSFLLLCLLLYILTRNNLTHTMQLLPFYPICRTSFQCRLCRGRNKTLLFQTLHSLTIPLSMSVKAFWI